MLWRNSKHRCPLGRCIYQSLEVCRVHENSCGIRWADPNLCLCDFTLGLFWIHNPEKWLRTVEGPVGARTADIWWTVDLIIWFHFEICKGLGVCLYEFQFFFPPFVRANPAVSASLKKWASIHVYVCLRLVFSVWVNSELMLCSRSSPFPPAERSQFKELWGEVIIISFVFLAGILFFLSLFAFNKPLLLYC